jgi:(S)-2-hydroxyglutarate dehydrogenase
VRRLDGEAALREVEPHVRGVAALHSPVTGVVDFRAVALALADDIRARGGEVRVRADVTGAQRQGARTVVTLRDGDPVAAGRAVFCAGRAASRLASSAGAPDDPRIVPFRGRYLTLTPEARSLVRGLVYPVPDPELPFLGVHLHRRIDGGVDLGPTALLTGGLAWPGTWRVVRRFWRTGAVELRHALSRRAMVAAGARYVPELRPEHVDHGWAGTRAQAVGRDGRLFDDFVFSTTGGALHVRNAPSPAATSALAIAEVVADRLDEAA